MANTQRMGFEGQALYGVKGATATTVLENARDISYGVQPNSGDTTVRGDSTAPPIETSKVTRRIVDIEIVMLNDTSDASLEAMKAAAGLGTPVAIRTRDFLTGKGFDGDCHLGFSAPYPLDGEQVVTITCKPTRDEGRNPVTYT